MDTKIIELEKKIQVLQTTIKAIVGFAIFFAVWGFTAPNNNNDQINKLTEKIKLLEKNTTNTEEAYQNQFAAVNARITNIKLKFSEAIAFGGKKVGEANSAPVKFELMAGTKVVDNNGTLFYENYYRQVVLCIPTVDTQEDYCR